VPAPWLTLAITLLTGLAVLVAVAAAVMARAILRPPRMTDGKAAYRLKRVTPADLGLAYEPQTFVVRDEQTGGRLRLAAWWLPCPQPATGRTCVLVHGYVDAKVGAIAWAPVLLDAGWHVLAIDLRAHGESGGTHVTAGFHERHDLGQVINELRAARPQQTAQVALFGLSMGTAVCAATAAMRDDLAAVVLDSPFADYREAVAVHFRLLGLPGGVVLRLAMALAAWRSGADFAAVAPARTLRTVRCPVLLIAGGRDPFLLTGQAASLVGSRGEVFNVPDVGHLMAYPSDPPAYRTLVRDFLARAALSRA